MLKRLNIYFKERYPIIPRLILGFIVFMEIHFIILLNEGITTFNIGIQEFVGAYTVFAFLLWLRIADDLKDFETDSVLFPDRPLPSGRVKRKDVMIICTIVEAIAVILNVLFMNNLLFFVILYFYGYLMSKWFFQKAKIQPCLPLALVTHNPVQMFINLYIISFTVLKYNVRAISIYTIMTLWTLYFPALIWEIARKIRAPKDETGYVTYSKLFGYKKSTKFILILTIVDIITNIILVFNLNKISVIVLIILVSWMTLKFIQFMRDPEQFKVVDKVERYTYLQESTMLITVAVFLIIGRI
ncbi:UbiA family prenyltransferase [Butyrivibrio sp. XBB1001]|uniref:UbiA family prenyltransferase n=1 Tax=Butyrivibrio sp. XBB1001 TaxID=1280682 RepID=UPI0004017318|nr:UbiA family prenyltransferase [Butyrivibrio sp. XBB1001]